MIKIKEKYIKQLNENYRREILRHEIREAKIEINSHKLWIYSFSLMLIIINIAYILTKTDFSIIFTLYNLFILVTILFRYKLLKKEIIIYKELKIKDK